MARRLWPHALPLILGLVLAGITFVALDPLWPAQDAPPAIAARYRADAARAAMVYAVAGWLTLGGAVWLAGVVVWRRLRS